MTHSRFAAVAAAFLLAIPAGAAAPWEGRWRLVTQTYEAGAVNLAPEDAPVHLDLVEASGLPTGRVWAGEDDRGAVPWPAWTKDPEGAAVAVVSRAATAAGAIESVYRVRPVATDDLVLHIRETYSLSADGAWLEGTIDVRFAAGEESRGGYTLHRRYARVR